MLIPLHKQATTVSHVAPLVRATMANEDPGGDPGSAEPAWMVAERYGISEQTVWKWRKRDSVHDRSHTAHRRQTTLTPAQGSIVAKNMAVSLRTALLLPLDDLLCVVREFLGPNVSR